MRKLKKLFSVIGVAAMIIMLCACSSESALLGKWERSGGSSFFYDSMEFFKDGTYIPEEGGWEDTYSVDGNRIKMNSDVFSFEIHNNELTLTNSYGYSERYTRVGKGTAVSNGGNIFKMIFTNWWTFEYAVQIIIAIIVFIVSMNERKKLFRIKAEKENDRKVSVIAQFTKRFLYFELCNLAICIAVNIFSFIMALECGTIFIDYGSPFLNGFCPTIIEAVSVLFICSVYYFGELNKSIECAYLFIEDGKIIARNPEMCGFSVRLAAIKDVRVLKYRPKKLPLAYWFFKFYKIEIYANDTAYEVCGVENAQMVKRLIEEKIGK